MPLKTEKLFFRKLFRPFTRNIFFENSLFSSKIVCLLKQTPLVPRLFFKIASHIQPHIFLCHSLCLNIQRNKMSEYKVLEKKKSVISAGVSTSPVSWEDYKSRLKIFGWQNGTFFYIDFQCEFEFDNYVVTLLRRASTRELT